MTPSTVAQPIGGKNGNQTGDGKRKDHHLLHVTRAPAESIFA